jgi:hypothetical protein
MWVSRIYNVVKELTKLVLAIVTDLILMQGLRSLAFVVFVNSRLCNRESPVVANTYRKGC